MHGPAPILRNVSVVAALQPSTKIPHLNYHILQRKAKPHASQQIRRTSVKHQQRWQSSVAGLEKFDPFDAHPDERATPRETFLSRSQSQHIVPLSNVSPTNVGDLNFYSILEKGSSDLILLALTNEGIGDPFVRDVSDELFNKALLSLDPDYFVTPQRRIYRYLQTREEEAVGSRGLRQIEERFLVYTTLLQRMIDLRYEGKHKLTLESCKHMLKWAASLGHETLAMRVFNEVMQADGVEPDVDCYNYYMEALNWSNAYSQVEKFSLRVLPVHLKIRGLLLRPARFSGYRTENKAAENIGIRGEILRSFKQLVESGQKANAATFINIMTAMGREGDIKGVTSILKSVWNIDLGLLELYDEDEIESPTFYDEGDPLRPTEDLLFALAHIFGSNNDARTAWTLVDYVSRSYAIPIPRHVWTELLEWYMVLSLQRGGAAKQKGYASGQISRGVFEQLFASMVDQPHNIQPDSAALYLQSRIRRDERVLEDQLESIKGLCARLDQSTTRMRKSMKGLTDYIRTMPQERLEHLWDQTQLFQLRRDFLTDSLDFEACLSMTRHAVVQRLLRYNFWAGGRKLTEWERRRLPQLVEEFSPYLPKQLQYRTTGGTVVLEDPDFQRSDAREPFGKTYRLMVSLRSALDTEDHDALLQGILKFKSARG